MGFLNSFVAIYYLEMLNPTTTFQVGNIGSLPFIFDRENDVGKLVKYNLSISIDDWDSFETSWDFIKHPLIKFRQSKALWGDPTDEDSKQWVRYFELQSMADFHRNTIFSSLS